MTTTPKPDAGGHTAGPCLYYRDDGMIGMGELSFMEGDNGERHVVDIQHKLGNVDPAIVARVCDCYNACIGIPDPTTLRTQRDDLLAVAKSLRAIIHDDLTHAEQQHHAEAINFADLVIAKAGGGK